MEHKYYYEEKFDPRSKANFQHRFFVYERGYIKHFAVFYDKDKVLAYIDYMNHSSP